MLPNLTQVRTLAKTVLENRKSQYGTTKIRVDSARDLTEMQPEVGSVSVSSAKSSSRRPESAKFISEGFGGKKRNSGSAKREFQMKKKQQILSKLKMCALPIKE